MEIPPVHFPKGWLAMNSKNLKPGMYYAILNNSDFSGYYVRCFYYPEAYATEKDISAEWYYLNRIDSFGCLQMVIPAEAFADSEINYFLNRQVNRNYPY